MNNVSTKRLILREIQACDSEEIVLWRSDSEVYKYFRNSHKITMKEHLEWFENNYKLNDNRIDFICIEKTSGEKIGVFGVVCDPIPRSVEVNYLLSEKARHKGYAEEAIKELILFSVNKWSVTEITAEIHKDNIPSISLVERIGFEIKKQNEHFIVYALNVGGLLK